MNAKENSLRTLQIFAFFADNGFKFLKMFPDSFIQRISGQKYIDSQALLKALEEPSPVSIRINPSKWDGIPADAEPVPWSSNGFYLKNRPSYTLDPLFHSGCYYPQEASGMFLEQVIRQTTDLAGDLRVLDLCAAPGGKSILLSDLIGPDNLLVANEAIRARAGILAETLTKWGSGNTLVTQNDPAAFGRLPGYFDVIVVDAPCSGEGMFRSEIALKEWSVSNALHCSERQKRILMDVWPALKENGILVYSTCTFNPGENEENIKWFIDRMKLSVFRSMCQVLGELLKSNSKVFLVMDFIPINSKEKDFLSRQSGKPDRRERRISGARGKLIFIRVKMMSLLPANGQIFRATEFLSGEKRFMQFPIR